MSGWVTFDEAYVLGALPSDVGVAYAAWIAANPEKAGRLETLTGQVRSDFRRGLAQNQNVPVDPDPTKLDVRCMTHALTIVVYHLTLEMGLMVNVSAQTAFINAQVYLRRLYLNREPYISTDVSTNASYRKREKRPGRSLD